MDSKKTVRSLLFKYPEKNIVQIPPEDPTEIICEVEPTSEHPDYSMAIAVIEKSEPHYHKLSTETYTVLSGSLVLKLAHRDVVLRDVVLHPGMDHTIPPDTVHSAEADGAWVRVTSRPGWTSEDYILMGE